MNEKVFSKVFRCTLKFLEKTEKTLIPPTELRMGHFVK